MTLDRLLRYLRYSLYLRGLPLLQILGTVFFQILQSLCRLRIEFIIPLVIQGL